MVILACVICGLASIVVIFALALVALSVLTLYLAGT